VPEVLLEDVEPVVDVLDVLVWSVAFAAMKLGFGIHRVSSK
jgi:hypothetical protein